MPRSNKWYGQQADQQSTANADGMMNPSTLVGGRRDPSSLTAKELYKEATTLARSAYGYRYYLYVNPRSATEDLRSRALTLDNRYNETMHNLYSKLTQTKYDSTNDMTYEALMNLDDNLRKADSDYAEIRQRNWIRVFLDNMKEAISRTTTAKVDLVIYQTDWKTQQIRDHNEEQLKKSLLKCNPYHETIKLMNEGSLFTLSETLRAGLPENEVPAFEQTWNSWKRLESDVRQLNEAHSGLDLDEASASAFAKRREELDCTLLVGSVKSFLYPSILYNASLDLSSNTGTNNMDLKK